MPTVAEIKEQLDELKVPYSSSATKAELLERLKLHSDLGGSSESDAPESGSHSGDTGSPELVSQDGEDGPVDSGEHPNAAPIDGEFVDPNWGHK